MRNGPTLSREQEFFFQNGVRNGLFSAQMAQHLALETAKIADMHLRRIAEGKHRLDDPFALLPLMSGSPEPLPEVINHMGSEVEVLSHEGQNVYHTLVHLEGSNAQGNHVESLGRYLTKMKTAAEEDFKRSGLLKERLLELQKANPGIPGPK